MRCYGNTRSRNAICRCLIYALQNIETPRHVRGDSSVEAVERATWVLFKVLLIWTRGQARSKSGFDRSQRHVTTRATALHISWSARSNDPSLPSFQADRNRRKPIESKRQTLQLSVHFRISYDSSRLVTIFLVHIVHIRSRNSNFDPHVLRYAVNVGKQILWLESFNFD